MIRCGTTMKIRIWHPALVPLGLVSLVNTLGISLLIPVLPTISEQFGGWYVMYGILLSLYSLCQFFAAPVWWSLSDRYGRKRIMIISQRGTLMSWIIFGLAWFMPFEYGFLGVSLPVWILVFARMCDGFSAGNAAVISAYITDIAHDNTTKIQYFGAMAAMMGVGVMLWPLLWWVSASFSSWGNFGTIISAAVLSLITLIVLWLTLPKLPRKELDTPLSIMDTIHIPRQIRRSTLESPSLGILRVLISVFYVLFLGYTTIYVLHATQAFGLSLVQIWLIGTGIGLVFALQQFVTLPRIHKHLSSSQILLLGHVCMMIWLWLITYTTSTAWFVISSLILTSWVAWVMTLFNTMLSNYTNGDNEWWLFGLKDSLIAAASIIAPLVWAWLYGLFSQEIFIIYALVALCMILLIHRSIKKNIL